MAPKDKNRNYEKENKWEDTPEQVARRVERNRARREAIRKGLVKKGDGKEVHHVDAPRKGSLKGVKTKVVSRAENRRIQPKRGKK
jgi:hypothetical protein